MPKHLSNDLQTFINIKKLFCHLFDYMRKPAFKNVSSIIFSVTKNCKNKTKTKLLSNFWIANLSPL